MMYFIERILKLYPLRRTVVVNTKTDRTFSGVLWSSDSRHLVIKNAEALRPKGERISVDGDLIIDRANVDFMQVI